jgi:Ca-activated chloride channel family protein
MNLCPSSNSLEEIRQRKTQGGRFPAVLSILIFAAGLFGQTQQQGDQGGKDQEGFQIGVEVNLVTVPITVRKTGGGFLKGLPQEAFRIFEDSVEQEIVMFAQEGVPTRIALVLDISGSVQSEWGAIKFSTKKFVENLQPEDQFAIITFDTETRLKMDWGDKTDRLEPVLTSIYPKGNTNLWDALWVVSDTLFTGIREKKAVIIMSDGLDNNSMVPYNDALDAAIRSEAAIYVVSKTQAVRDSLLHRMAKAGYYNGISSEVFAQADMALRKLAYETGGRVLYPNTFGQLDNIYAEVDDELRNQYTIGYVSNNQVKDGGYRRIRVAVNAPEASVSARPGYFAHNDLPSADSIGAGQQKN